MIVNPPLFSWPKARCRNRAGRRDSLFRIQTARQGAGSLYGVVRGLKEYGAPFSLMLLVRKNCILVPHAQGTHGMIRMKDLRREE